MKEESEGKIGGPGIWIAAPEEQKLYLFPIASSLPIVTVKEVVNNKTMICFFPILD